MSVFLSHFATVLPAIQIGISILLVITILMQSRGTGMGAAFGGGSSVYRTKRGIEKGLFRASITLGVLFALTSLARLVI